MHACVCSLVLIQHKQILRKICDHPLLLTKRDTDDFLEEMGAMLNNRDMCMVERILEDNLYADKRLQIVQGASCKIAFILPLLVSASFMKCPFYSPSSPWTKCA